MVPFRGGLVAVGAAVLATAGLTACSGSSSGTDAGTRPGTSTTSASPTCPAPPSVAPAQWLPEVPADLPKPPGASIDSKDSTGTGVHFVKFTTPTSLRDSVLFVVQTFPKAGYTLGRGDAEATEADAPFVHGNIRGLVRMMELGRCQTQWVLAVVDTSTSRSDTPLKPFLPHPQRGSTSPLPFG